MSSKFKVLLNSYIPQNQMPNFRNYVNLDITTILLVHKRHILKIFEFSKKNFFCDFRWVLQANLNVFLICQKMCSILCAMCPKIKNFVWDNTLVPRVLKYRLVCICGHVAQIFFYFSLWVWKFWVNRKMCWIYKPIWTFFFKNLNCQKMCPILCAIFPKLKNFVWDITLVPKVLKYWLVCICGHMAHFFFLIFPSGYGNLEPIEKYAVFFHTQREKF